MRKAKVQIAAVYATCPYCGMELADPDTGSQMLVIGQFPADYEYECDGCGMLIQLPKGVQE